MRELMSKEQILAKANVISLEHGLKAEFLGDAQYVGVQGDERVYSYVIVLVGPFPGWEVLEQVSSRISNIVDAKVTYELARKPDTPR